MEILGLDMEVALILIAALIPVAGYLFLMLAQPKKEDPFESEIHPEGKYGARIMFFGKENPKWAHTPQGYDGHVRAIRHKKNGLLEIDVGDLDQKLSFTLYGISMQDNIRNPTSSSAGVGKVIWLCNKDVNQIVYPWNPVAFEGYIEQRDKVLEDQVALDTKMKIDADLAYQNQRSSPETVGNLQKVENKRLEALYGGGNQ
jgi:hypothetical protein